MTVDALISRCHALGVTLAPGPAGRLRVSPPGALPEELREELKRCKAEVLTLLEAVTWLREKLTDGPRHIAPLIAEWCGGEEVRQRDGTLRWEGGRDGTNERWIDDLMQARWTLGVEAYEGEDERFWWRLHQETVQ